MDKKYEGEFDYMFKFVVPSDKVQEFQSAFETESLQSKKSKSGKYSSFTLKKMMSSSEEVVEIYLKAKKIEGIIAL